MGAVCNRWLVPCAPRLRALLFRCILPVLFSGLEAAAMGMMDPGFMQEAMEMMKDPAVMKQVMDETWYKVVCVNVGGASCRVIPNGRKKSRFVTYAT